MARMRNSSSGVIDLPGDDTDPSIKKRAGMLDFPGFVDSTPGTNGIFNSKVPDYQLPHNNISGKGRGGKLNLYNYGDSGYRNDEDGPDLKTI